MASQSCHNEMPSSASCLLAWLPGNAWWRWFGSLPKGLKIKSLGNSEASSMIFRTVAMRNVCSALLANLGRVICRVRETWYYSKPILLACRKLSLCSGQGNCKADHIALWIFFGQEWSSLCKTMLHVKMDGNSQMTFAISIRQTLSLFPQEAHKNQNLRPAYQHIITHLPHRTFSSCSRLCSNKSVECYEDHW